MDFNAYRKLLLALPIGKKLNNVLYVHVQSLASLSNELYALQEKIRSVTGALDDYNVIKFFLSEFKLSLLAYPDFFDTPHPVLKSSVSFNLANSKTRIHDYHNVLNPPILHRKELLLHPEHPMIKIYRGLTQAEESEGLYESTKTIGFKLNWEALLALKGLSYDGHTLIKKEQPIPKRKEPAIKVDRHRTAISRYALSKPIQTLIEHDFVNESTSLFDYGCGQGDDLKGLSSMGYQVAGWDPVHMPEEQKRHADIVNLGYVVNIIEEPAERTEVLLDAFSICKKMLVVSSMIATSSTVDAGRSYKDGILTSRNTFQKYFQQSELQQYIEDVLETSAVAVAPGIFYVFKYSADQQQFLSKRSKRYINWEELSLKLYPSRPKRQKATEKLYDQNKELLEAFWNRMIDLGRVPIESEFDNYDEITLKIGSAKKAKNLFVQKFGQDTLKEAFHIRRDDLLVYLALTNFRKTIPLRQLPDWLQTDIKTFFGGYAKALQEGRQLLFFAGNPDIITELCNKIDFGFLDEQALYIHKSLADDLHPILRVYLGCAEILYGDLTAADIIKIHKRSGKLTLLKYDNFDNNPEPVLLERTKINLRTQHIDVFDHSRLKEKQPLVSKEKYLSRRNA